MSEELKKKLQELKNKKIILEEENKLKDLINKEREEIKKLKNRNNFIYKLFNKDD